MLARRAPPPSNPVVPSPRLHPAAAALAAVLLAACGADSLTGPGPRRSARQPAPGHTPVLFAHGWNSNAAAWTTMTGRFRADGWKVSELATFPYNTGQSNAVTAQLIAGKVDSIRLATGAARVSIVTHSMGALSARYYVRDLGSDGKVDDARVSLGGPNHGTATAYACLQTSCREKYPSSSFLTALNATDETWGAPRYATWRSPCDEVINPRSSTALADAANIQTSCLSHSQLRESAAVYRQVRDSVDRPATTRVVAARGG